MDSQSPMEPPPPAYDLEHDYDRKISDAVERSLTISNHSSSLPSGEDEWEEWDEARFEAAAAAGPREHRAQAQSPLPISRPSLEKERLARQYACQPDRSSGEASSSSSSVPVIQPSRKLPASPPTKERPSWYSEAQLDAPAVSTSSQNNQASSAFRGHNIPPEEDDPDEPLPPFVPVGPSLEGPPFEEVVNHTHRFPPGSSVDSPPQSPLDGADSDALPERPPSPPPPTRRVYRDSYHSTSPRQSVTPAQPRTAPVSAASVSAASPRPPPMRFDPSVAYAKHRNINVFSQEAESREPVDASAFYNSAVSSLLGPSRTSKKSNTLPKDTTASSDVNRSRGSMPPVPSVPESSPAHYGASTINPHYLAQTQPYMSNQHIPYSQPLPRPSQQVVPGFNALAFQGVAPGPLPPPPPPPHWPPPTNMYGSGYGR